MIVFCLCVFILITGCESEQNESINGRENKVDARGQTEIDGSQNDTRTESSPIEYKRIAKNVEFKLNTPEEAPFEVYTDFELSGTLEYVADTSYVLVSITPKAIVEEFEHDDFNYYIPVEDGTFSQRVQLHYGAGDYQVRLFAPIPEYDDSYHEVTRFTVTNKDAHISRDIEYTIYGLDQQFQLSSPLEGMNESDDGSIQLQGVLPDSKRGEVLLAEIKKESDTEQVSIPIHKGQFATDLPLFFGEGLHHVRLYAYDPQDDTYYEAASFYVQNEMDTTFSKLETNDRYIDSGIILNRPNMGMREQLDQMAYPISGRIDQSAPLAKHVDNVIVTVRQLDEQVESSYLIPVLDGEFSGEAFFRFGPGPYEILISVPNNVDNTDPSKYQYSPVAVINHEVVGISDERDLLPSWGIQSDHPKIKQLAQELTAGKPGERNQAKAIYSFVARHIAYDVAKAEADTFNIADSALSALETGTGVCQDYAYLATALLRAAGINAHYVEGDAGERHAWVEAHVNGEWIEMDPTWGAGYVENGRFYPHYTEDFFDPDPNFLAETHTRTGIVY
nr:transglutaminase-like domain-containing protein [Lentibacillus saliphilus]